MGRLQTARLENFIRRWGSIKGGGSVLSETLGDVFPILDLENLTPENQLTAGWFLFGGNTFATGGVGDQAGCQIANLAGSGNLVVIDKLLLFSQTSQPLTMGSSNALFSASAAPRNRDLRTRNLLNGMAQMGISTNAITEFFGDITVVANITRELEVPNGIAVLPPGTQFSVATTNAATFLKVGFYGRARLAEPSELSF